MAGKLADYFITRKHSVLRNGQIFLQRILPFAVSAAWHIRSMNEIGGFRPTASRIARSNKVTRGDATLLH
jgi:hypothetical protein